MLGDKSGLGRSWTRLERTLAVHGIPHDLKEYPGVGHRFMNDHDPADITWVFALLPRISHTRFDPRDG